MDELFLCHRWMRIKFECSTAGKVAVKTIVKTFAAGKTEKLVAQALTDVELPSEKVTIIDSIHYLTNFQYLQRRLMLALFGCNRHLSLVLW